MAILEPDGTPVEIGGVVLSTPGLGGVGEASLPAVEPGRSESHVPEALAIALRDADLLGQIDVELTDLSYPAAPGGGRGGGNDTAIVAQVPGPGAGLGQVALVVDEDGLLSWHMPETADTGEPGTRGGSTTVYRIPVRPPVADADGRGPIGWLGKKVIKILTFGLVDDALGAVGRYLAGRWERGHRWYGLSTAGGGPVDWTAVAAGPALMLVHGTFSRGRTGFASLLGSDLRAHLEDAYGSRVLIFDHPTVSVDPLANARWLAEQVATATPDGTQLVLDLVTHSRGGLVARALTEQQDQLPLGLRRIEVRSLVFVATPNSGTALADMGHLKKLLDVFTNLLDLVPDVGTVDVIQMVLEVVKQLATGLLDGLDGLTSMDPHGAYLAELNKSAAERDRYAGVGANFEPAKTDLRSRALDMVTDALFRAENDLVVPREGVWTVDGRALIPTARRLTIDAVTGVSGVSHSAYFGREDVQQHLRTWLGA